MRTEPVGLIVGLLSLLVPGRPAEAQEPTLAPPTTAAQLEVQAAPDCASREELVARVAARSRRIRFQDEVSGGPHLHATISPGPGGTVVGELVVVQPGGKRSVRRLSASSCAEATDALALVVAITLDPTFVVTAPPAADANRPAVAEPARAPPPTATVAVAEPRQEVATATSGIPNDVTWHRRFGAGVTAEAIFGPAPRALPGFGFQAIAALDRASIWSPALLLRATHAWTRGLLEPGGTADFTLDALALDACPVRLDLALLEARACGMGLVGRLSANGSNTYSPRAAVRPYAALGGSAVVIVTLGGILELSGRFGAGASLVRDAFEFNPKVFHRESSVTLVVDLGVGVRFP